MKSFLAVLLALTIYRETPMGKPLNPLDKPPNPYQRDCYFESENGAIVPCKF